MFESWVRSGTFQSSSSCCTGLSGLLQLSSGRGHTSRHLPGLLQSFSSWCIKSTWHRGFSWSFDSFSGFRACWASPRPFQSCSSGRVGLVGRSGFPRPLHSPSVPFPGRGGCSFSRRLCQPHSGCFPEPLACRGSPGFPHLLSAPRAGPAGEISFWLFHALSVRPRGLVHRGGPARPSLTPSEPFPKLGGRRESPWLFLSAVFPTLPACQAARPLSAWLLQSFSERWGGLVAPPALRSDLKLGLGERGLLLPLSSCRVGLEDSLGFLQSLSTCEDGHTGRRGTPVLSGCRAGLGERRSSLGSLLRCSGCQESRWP